jgi:hypothetical protein
MIGEEGGCCSELAPSCGQDEDDLLLAMHEMGIHTNRVKRQVAEHSSFISKHCVVGIMYVSNNNSK